MINRILFTLLAIALQQISVAQPVVVKLWPKGIPQSKVEPNYKEQLIEQLNKKTWFNVTDPELYIYNLKTDTTPKTAVIICPGDNYQKLLFTTEGEDVAKWFNEHGIAAFVLKYRSPSDSIMEDKSVGPLQDVQEALRIVRRNAKEWSINPKKIGIMGFSAGGHLAATLSTHYNNVVYPLADTISARPDFTILIYPMITVKNEATYQQAAYYLLGSKPDIRQALFFSGETQVNKNVAPTFIVHSVNDKIVFVDNSIAYFNALKKNSIAVEMHIYPTGAHGYGLATLGESEKSWPEACLNWLNYVFLKEKNNDKTK